MNPRGFKRCCCKCGIKMVVSFAHVRLELPIRVNAYCAVPLRALSVNVRDEDVSVVSPKNSEPPKTTHCLIASGKGRCLANITTLVMCSLRPACKNERPLK